MLIKPDITLAEEIRAYRKAFLERGDSMDGTGSLRWREDPADWIADNVQCSQRETAPEGFVPATQFVCLNAQRKIVGMIQVRHELNDYLAKYGGHIGYSVHPDERRKGYATGMLHDALAYCREIGLERVLVTCNADNPGSRKTIIKNGGVYESACREPGEDTDTERYWISLTSYKEEKIMDCRYAVKKVEAPCWEQIESVELHHQPWLAACDIRCKAQLCHDGENLYVRMEAKEGNIRAELTGALDQVCNDSCMEFFFAPKMDDARYFNFEWNKLCNAYVGFGAERKTRVRQILKNPKETFAPVSGDTADGWMIEYRIPLSFIRMYVPEFAFAGEAACNFYKCGDMTEIPHYLAWAPLSGEKPDYHRRWDFGTLVFE